MQKEIVTSQLLGYCLITYVNKQLGSKYNTVQGLAEKVYMHGNIYKIYLHLLFKNIKMSAGA